MTGIEKWIPNFFSLHDWIVHIESLSLLSNVKTMKENEKSVRYYGWMVGGGQGLGKKFWSFAILAKLFRVVLENSRKGIFFLSGYNHLGFR